MLVAGGAGFVGSHLCDALIARGDSVVCVDNLVTGSASNVEHLSGRDDFAFVEHDIVRDMQAVVGDLGPIDGVFNLASPASPKDYLALPLETLAVGSRGTANLLELAGQNGARFLQASTSEVYGDPLEHPQPETYWGNVNPIGPRSVYDEAKRFGEALCFAHERELGLDLRVVRIFNTYGPRMKPDDGRVVSNFLIQALQGQPLTVYGDGQQTRSFCFVDDLVRGLLVLFDSHATGPVNIGNETENTMLELAEEVLRATGSASVLTFEPLPVDDPTKRCPDTRRAQTELGWEAMVPLADGLEQTASFFRSTLSDPPS